ncbi:MAG: hypothetical protein AB7L65_04255 [Hyphomonadaceae bacterium]
MDHNTLDAARDDVVAALRRSANALGLDLVRVGRDADRAVDDIGSALSRSGRRVSAALRDDLRRGQGSLAKAVEEHPLAFLGGAAAFGFVLGALLPRR